MKVLFINISDIRGGSALAAYRLSKELEGKFCTKNLFVVRKKTSNDIKVIQSRKNVFEEKIEWIINIFFNFLGLQYKFLPFSPKRILKIAKQFQPDIINLHNIIGGYFNIKDLIKLNSIAPLVWTLHDMWAFTGNAAHTFGDNSWKFLKTGRGENKIYPQIFLPTGRLLLKEKEKIYAKVKMKIITPSEWLYDLASQSPVFEHKEIYMIHHGVDLNLFKPNDCSDLHHKLSIPKNSKVILFSAEKINRNSFKGGKELADILSLLDDKAEGEIYLITLGFNKWMTSNVFRKLKIKNLGYITDEIELAKIYSFADIFIYPTKADSFGLVLLESIACGTPCISFKVGGCTDIIKNDISGYLISEFNTFLFVSKIIELLRNEKKLKYLSISARKYAEENFSIELMAQRYYEVFKSF